MELIIKKFDELTVNELYDILKLRVDVFVVEQECPYPEIDNKDQNAYHIWLKDEDGIAAYVRVLDKGVSFEDGHRQSYFRQTQKRIRHRCAQRGHQNRKRKIRCG